MTIRLITGLPGSGKSLRGVQQIREASAQGRNVYVDGLEGLQEFGWERCDAYGWQDLPDGSLVVIDEAQKKWGTRRTAEPPDYIRALSEHRHRGFDFVLITQHPTMLDAYVRKLINGHEHLIRQFGAEVSKVVTWQECQDDPQSLGTRDRGTVVVWRYPRDLFPLYKSATLHTVKRKLPLRVVMLPLLLVLLAVVAWYGYTKLSSIEHTASKTAVVADATGKATAIPELDAGAAEYVAKSQPRVPGMPWSAPLFDDRKPKAEPDIYCVYSAKGCRCYSEQITRLNVPVMQCMTIARDGVYNPYRDPIDKHAPPPAAQEALQPSADKSVVGANAGGGLKAGATFIEGSHDAETWPRPDLSYKVPFPGVAHAR